LDHRTWLDTKFVPYHSLMIFSTMVSPPLPRAYPPYGGTRPWALDWIGPDKTILLFQPRLFCPLCPHQNAVECLIHFSVHLFATCRLPRLLTPFPFTSTTADPIRRAPSPFPSRWSLAGFFYLSRKSPPASVEITFQKGANPLISPFFFPIPFPRNTRLLTLSTLSPISIEEAKVSSSGVPLAFPQHRQVSLWTL